MAKSFLEILQWTPEQARAYLEEIRWPDGPVCPNGCASEVYRFEAKTRRRDKNGEWKVQPPRQLLKCKQCRRQFTVTVGTIFEDSKIPLTKWIVAIHLMCASKKGVSAHQLHRMLDVGYEAAWFMAHRVRHAMKDKSGPLSGIIEADETYVGGKPRGHRAHRAGRRTMSEAITEAWEKKTPVFGILERGGRVRTVVIPSIGRREIINAINEHVDTERSQLMTDESPLYGRVERIIPHNSVKHADEYVTGDEIHTQGIEGFWSLLKRQLYGTHHHVAPGFLGMYADEAAFKYNTRKQSDGERFASALQGVGGRLTWYVGKASEEESPSTP